MPLDDSPAAASWPDLDRTLLTDGSGPPPAFPLALLPPRWRSWTERSAQSFTPVDYVAQALLGLVSTACGAGVVVRITPHWFEPLLLWQALVGGPSSGKSPALAAGWRLIEALAPAEERSGDVEVETAGDEAEAGEPCVLPPPRVCGEGDLRTLIAAASRSPRGATLWRDELGDWIVRAQCAGERAGWLAGWSGEAASARPRPNMWDVDIERFPLTVLGGLSTDRLGDILRGDDAGFASRLLFAWPGPVLNLALNGEAADDAGARAMLRRISSLASAAESPGRLSLGPDAMARLQELLPRLGRMNLEAEGSEAAWIGKGIGTVVRLAGLLHLMRWAEAELGPDDVPEGIAGADFDCAWELWSGYFLPHARRVFAQAGDALTDRLVRRAARWLKRSRLNAISREDIRRDALCQSVNAEAADQVIERLELAGFVRSVQKQGTGGRPRLRWEVNPELR